MWILLLRVCSSFVIFGPRNIRSSAGMNHMSKMLKCFLLAELLGFETISVEVENPFGTDFNDLPLDTVSPAIACCTLDCHIITIFESLHLLLLLGYLSISLFSQYPQHADLRDWQNFESWSAVKLCVLLHPPYVGWTFNQRDFGPEENLEHLPVSVRTSKCRVVSEMITH